jgi:hypothetical protein
MLSRAISIFLIATILNCPLYCSWSAGGVGAEGKACCRGCCHPSSQPASGERSCPARDSGKCCQCICGGAVIGDAATLDIGFDASLSLPVVDLAVTSVLSQVSNLPRIRTTPWPDDGVNVGRALCCLYSTLLC